jgi:hypothetical protein
MWRCIALVRTDVSEECEASIIRVKFRALGKMLPVTIAFFMVRDVTPCGSFKN